MTNKLALKGGAPLRTRPFPRWPQPGEVERQLLLEVYDSGCWGFNGPKEQEFARRFAEFNGAKYGLCVTNGTVSLEIALRALRIGPGDEVIVPALTWLATAGAVVQVGAKPIFADVRQEDWCLDPSAVRQAITPQTKAIIPVHLYNQMAEMDELGRIAKEHSISIIEDCAHAHGSQWEGRGAGTLGRMGSYSFQQSKSMTAGEGGILLTDDPELAASIHSLKHCGRKWKPESEFGFGGNYRMTEFQAAILTAQLAQLEQQLVTKARNVALFEKHLSAVKGIAATQRKPKVTRPGMYGLALNVDPEAFGNLPLEILVSALVAEGIPAQRPYDVIYRSPLWTSGTKTLRPPQGIRVQDLLGLSSQCPLSERISNEEGVVLLHHLFLGTEEDMADLAEGFRKVQENAGELRREALEKKLRTTARSLLRKVGLG